jgi:rare lipoprotein A
VRVVLRQGTSGFAIFRSWSARSRPYLRTVGAVCVAALLTAACSNTGNRAWDNQETITEYSPRVVAPGQPIPKGGGRRKLGAPYKIGGVIYTPRHEPDYARTGIASWYGRDFHGRLTANGEVYDMHDFTAAHPTLPLPSLVEVTNMENSRTVIVRVNDRGPFKKGRIIDLSRRSADALGLLRRGTGRVHVRYLGPAPLQPATR